MDSKLQKLLDQISWDESKKSYFEGATLEKIVGNSEHTDYTFVISLSDLLPSEIFDEFIHVLKEGFKEQVKSTRVRFQVENPDLGKVKEYFTYLMNRYAKKCPILESFIESEVEIKEDVLIIPVDYLSEEQKLFSLEKELVMDFRSFGFAISRINPVLKEDPISVLEEESEIVVEQARLEQKDVIVEDKPAWKKNFTPKKIETVDDPNVLLGRVIDTNVVRLDTISGPTNGVTLEAELFGIEERETKTDLIIVTLKITDYTDSIYAKIFVNGKEDWGKIKKGLKCGKWYKFRGNIKEDKYSNEDVLSILDINYSDYKKEEIIDDAPIKRVELHAHTMMSQMDGITKLDLGKHTCELVERTMKMGYRGVAITDHNGCQAFPIAFGIITSYNKGIVKKLKGKVEELEGKIAEVEDASEKESLQKELEETKESLKNPPIFKGLYGTELTLVDDTVNIVVRPRDYTLEGTTFVVFDTETTGFNAAGGDQMIEMGAVKIQDGNIIDRFDELIDPGRHIPDKITELTCITDEMVKGKDSEEEVTKRFLEWTGDLPMVAHNAKFDISFIEMSMRKYNLGEFTNTVIDTLELSRTLDQGYSRHGLSALVKRYNVPWEEDAHHRADYDSEGTALIFYKMLKKLELNNFKTIQDLYKYPFIILRK